MKTCSKCKVEKSLQEFNKSGRSKDGYHCYCRDCHKEHYANNKVRHVSRVSNRKKELVDLAIRWKFEYLINSGGCSYDGCSVTEPVMLEFDHLNPAEKKYSISRMVQDGYTAKALEREAAKCRILCANHHRLHTAKQFNWKVFMPS